MEWKIRPITEDAISKTYQNLWPSLSDEEKKYMKKLYLTVCVTNDEWQVELDKITKLVASRSKKNFTQESDSVEEESEEDDLVEIDSEEIEEKIVKKTKPEAKYKVMKSQEVGD